MKLVHKLSLVVIVLIAAWFAGCGFTKHLQRFDPCSNIENVPVTPANITPPSTIYEDKDQNGVPTNSFILLGGTTTATVAGGAGLRIDQNVNLPPYANEATVFLNGWKAAYNDTDHHLFDVSALIGRIRVTPGQNITWTATGDLADNGEKSFTWTYHYLIIAWNNTAVRAMVDHNDGELFCRTGQPSGEDNFFQAENTDTPESTTALSSFASFLSNSRFSGGRQVAVLPRGFVFSWSGASAGDHHLFQLGYNLESAAPFVRGQPYHKATKLLDPLPNGAAQVANGEFASWKTSIVFKDNSRRRDYNFFEFVSGMGGADVEVIQPEFVILPREDVDANIVGGAASGLKSLDVVIGNLPYAYAVPILTGWEIGYTPPGEGDQHVKELGIFLEQVGWQPPAAGGVMGTLRYRVSSILTDKDSFPGNFFRHKVTVLGLKPTGAGVAPRSGTIATAEVPR